MDVCRDVDILTTISLIKIIINVLKIVVPIILIIMISIDIVKVMTSNDPEPKSITQIALKRIAAALIVFLVPTFIDLALDSAGSNSSSYLACYSNADKETIKTISIDNAQKALTTLSGNLTTLGASVTKENVEALENSYKQAEEDVSKVKDTSTKDTLETQLSTYKSQVDAIADAYNNSQNNSNNNNGSNSTSTTNDYILVGDSRFVGMCSQNVSSCSCSSDTCSCDKCIAKTSQGYSWLTSTAVSQIQSILNNNSSKTYSIVFALGVNDLGDTNSYISEYKTLASKWSKHKIVIAAVGPINDSKAASGYSVVNSSVTAFNSTMSSAIKNASISNLSYCSNTYDSISGVVTDGSMTVDGVHYTSSTYKTVYNAILNNCLK